MPSSFPLVSSAPNPPSENEGSNTDHDVDNGEQPDNGDDTSSNDEDNHSSDDSPLVFPGLSLDWPSSSF
jgi:hypothetical protein